MNNKIQKEEPTLSALVFGATGLVGSELIKLLCQGKIYHKVIVANREKKNYTNSMIEEVIVDFNALKKSESIFNVDHVFICLGTTINKAGSKEAFEKVDLQYPVQIAKTGKS